MGPGQAGISLIARDNQKTGRSNGKSDFLAHMFVTWIKSWIKKNSPRELAADLLICAQPELLARRDRRVLMVWPIKR